MRKKPYRIWLVEGKSPWGEDWTPVFSFGKSNEDIPRIVWPRYNTRKQARTAAVYMQKENPDVSYRAARYERVEK